MEDERANTFENLFNAITPWVIGEIVISILLIWLFIKVSERLLPVLAEWFPARLRQGTLSLVPVLRVLALIVLMVWITPLIFNVTLRNFILVAGALSVAIGFALKDLSSSVIAGLVALFEKPYRLGDWVRVDDHYGEVITVGMRAFQIRTADDDVVTLPNDRIWTSSIANANDGADTLMCVAKFHLAPGQPLAGVSAILEDIARTSPYLNLDRPIVVVTENAAFAVVYRLKAYPFEPRDQFSFVTDLTQRANDALLKAGFKTVVLPELASQG